MCMSGFRYNMSIISISVASIAGVHPACTVNNPARRLDWLCASQSVRARVCAALPRLGNVFLGAGIRGAELQGQISVNLA